MHRTATTFETDETLMRRYQSDDPQAFDELYRRHSARVYGYLRKLAGSPAEADDLLQQTFLRLHRGRDRYDDALPFLPWLFAIARHAWIDACRKRTPVALPPEAVERVAERSVGAASGAEPAAELREILALLPVDQRQLLEQRFDEGLSFETIAARAGVSEAAIRKRLSRAMSRVRSLWRGDAGEGTAKGG
jgi:RNA polymerase sigma-70 factor (ECF subfamily)